MESRYLLISILIIFVFGCQSNTEWTKESIDNKHLTWNGSWDNSEKLKVFIHGVKIYKDEDNYEWAFRVKIAYIKNNSDDTEGTYLRNMGRWTPPSSDLCIPVRKIKYSIYDGDDFLIDSNSVIGDCVKYADTVIFQAKKKISKDLIKNFEYGKVNIEAGYPSEDSTEMRSILDTTESNESLPSIEDVNAALERDHH